MYGLRYRTLPREELWEKAVAGQTTALQRREKRLGGMALEGFSEADG